jgi:hypothetical protein
VNGRRGARRLGAVALVLAGAIVTAACAAPSVDRRFPSLPADATATSAAAIDAASPFVVVFIDPAAGERIRLISAEPMLEGVAASVSLELSRPVLMADGSRLVGEDTEPLEGAVVIGSSDDPADTIGIVATMTVHEPGIAHLAGIRLRYALGAGIELEASGTDVDWWVCADDPKPVSCDPPGLD